MVRVGPERCILDSSLAKTTPISMGAPKFTYKNINTGPGHCLPMSSSFGQPCPSFVEENLSKICFLSALPSAKELAGDTGNLAREKTPGCL